MVDGVEVVDRVGGGVGGGRGEGSSLVLHCGDGDEGGLLAAHHASDGYCGDYGAVAE